MRFGVIILPEHRWSDAAPLWRRAEELGFDHAWTFDHITWGGLPDSRWFAAVPTLTAAAMVTERIRLGTLVATPNNHHPVQFQREVLALDDISGGRLLLGLGSGGELDAGILGETLALRDRTARFHEFTALLDRLLREEVVTGQGRFYGAREVRMRPGPARGQPDDNRIPQVIAANGPRAIRLAVDRGDAWLTNGATAETVDAWWDNVAGRCHVADKALAAAGLERHTLRRFLNLDDLPTYALTSVAAFEDAVGRADELGFTDVTVPWPRPDGPFRGDVAVLEAAATDVLPRWQAG
jgi:alkanesulfonate monooxygenase SsuD/methylene tetrahydromethanopterin reductase-like flavin-dependent oxidoreductase (luciferase family)